jgi:hypothetical protein
MTERESSYTMHASLCTRSTPSLAITPIIDGQIHRIPSIAYLPKYLERFPAT